MVRSVIPALQLSTRAAVAAGLSVAIAQALHFQQPLALSAAVLVTDLSPAQTRKLALPRFAGTLVGVLMGIVLSRVMQPNPWTIGAGILATMLLCHLLRLQEAARLAGFICGLILLNYNDVPHSYGYRRVLETALGIGLAVLVSFVPKLIRVEEESGGMR